MNGLFAEPNAVTLRSGLSEVVFPVCGGLVFGLFFHVA